MTYTCKHVRLHLQESNHCFLTLSENNPFLVDSLLWRKLACGWAQTPFFFSFSPPGLHLDHVFSTILERQKARLFWDPSQPHAGQSSGWPALGAWHIFLKWQKVICARSDGEESHDPPPPRRDGAVWAQVCLPCGLGSWVHGMLALSSTGVDYSKWGYVLRLIKRHPWNVLNSEEEESYKSKIWSITVATKQGCFSSKWKTACLDWVDVIGL